jgi:hypothetical protein
LEIILGKTILLGMKTIIIEQKIKLKMKNEKLSKLKI